jgi:hypothetical protein
MSAARVREFLKNRSGSMTAEFVLMVPVLLRWVLRTNSACALEHDVMTRDVRAAVRYLSARLTMRFIDNAGNLAKPATPRQYEPLSVGCAVEPSADVEAAVYRILACRNSMQLASSFGDGTVELTLFPDFLRSIRHSRRDRSSQHIGN